jgi:cytochrome c oxidase subunit I
VTEALAIPYVATTPEVGEDAAVESRRVGGLFLGVGLALFAVMGLLGLAMRFAQGDAYHLSPVWFYRIMTLHGAGMLVAAMLCQIGAVWYLLRADVGLRARRAVAVLALMVAGAVTVLLAVLAGGFAAGWTFLYPLPFNGDGQWGSNATAAFLTGLGLVGAGFQLFCLDVLLQTTARFGGLARTLGIDDLRDRDPDPPPPQVIAAAVVAIDGLITAAIGTLTVVALYGRVLDGRVDINPLWAKNVTFFFGHSFANLIIYLAVGAIHVLLPRYAGRPWKTTKPIVYAWLATLVFVVIAYFHHLYMDFVQPRAFEFISAFASSAAAIPVLVVTVYTAVMLIWGSRYRWTLASTLLYLGLPGWLIGGAGAVIDSMIPMNFRLHNTLWVPAHFHTYLLLAVMLWAMAHAAHLLERWSGRPARRSLALAAPALMVVGGYGLVGTWFVSGALGIPRRCSRSDSSCSSWRSSTSRSPAGRRPPPRRHPRRRATGPPCSARPGSSRCSRPGG